jgi:hypothetical protein
MGSKLSSSFAKIVCSFFEKKIIQPEIISGHILHYRYVDDIFGVLKKVQKYSVRKTECF